MSTKKSSLMPGDVENLRRRSVADSHGETKLLCFHFMASIQRLSFHSEFQNPGYQNVCVLCLHICAWFKFYLSAVIRATCAAKPSSNLSEINSKTCFLTVKL